MDVIRVAAFAQGQIGGNPAGVVIADEMPPAADMQAVAAEVGYAETVFATKNPDGSWQARYFSPEHEVPFCGHATIALGAILGERFGAGEYPLHLIQDQISVTATKIDAGWSARLRSPKTWSQDLPTALCDQLMELFAITPDQLDARLPPMLAYAGVQHAVFVLRNRSDVAAMKYPFDAVKAAMAAANVTTITLAHITADDSFATRNAFAIGGVVEDPATGAAAAALGGALVDRDWPAVRGGGSFTIIQGADMGSPSRLLVTVTGRAGDAVEVSGTVRNLD